MGASAEARGRRQARTLTLKGALTGGSHTVGCSSKISFTEMICPLLFFTFFSLRRKYQNLERARTGSVLHLSAVQCPRAAASVTAGQSTGAGVAAALRRRPCKLRGAAAEARPRTGEGPMGHTQLHSIHRRLRHGLGRQVPPDNLVLVVLHACPHKRAPKLRLRGVPRGLP